MEGSAKDQFSYVEQMEVPWVDEFRTVEIAYIFLMQLQREIIGTLNRKI